jgi:hypothetical protein
MSFIDEKTVKVENCILNWDGITRPEKRDDGSLSYNLRVCVHPQAPEVGELAQIATNALNEGQFKGAMPPNGKWPLETYADHTKLGPLVQGMLSIGGGSNRVPSCYDINGQKLDITQFGGMLYPGCKVAILLTAFSYSNKNKGITFGLEGFQIIDPSAPKLDVGGGMNESQVANAFGGQAGAAPQGQAPVQSYAPQGQPNYAPQGQPNQAPAQNYAPQGQPNQAPAQNYAPQGQPNQAPAQNYAPQGQPNQAPQGQAPAQNYAPQGQPNQAPPSGAQNGTPVQSPGYMNPQ